MQQHSHKDLVNRSSEAGKRLPSPVAERHMPGSRLLRPQAPMQANAKPTVAPRDDHASNAEEPAPTKMNDRHNKLEHAMPVRTHRA